MLYTKPNKKLIQFSKNCDLLIHEATYPYDFDIESIEREHSTTKQAAEIGKAATAKQIILTHIGTRVLNFKKENEILSEIGNEDLHSSPDSGRGRST